MIRTGALAGLLTLLGLLAPPPGSIAIDRNTAIPDFPREIRFELAASGSAEIMSAELEFGTDAMSCGESTTRAFPQDFTSGTTIETEWTWDMRRTGALPPGTVVQWHWTLQDAEGAQATTPVQSLLFTDDAIPWRMVEADPILLYWHEGSEAFAHSLLDAGQEAMAALQESTGVILDGEVEVYIYASSAEMQSATLFAPDWSGGLAFPNHRAVLIGIDPGDLSWGTRALAHELTHVVIGAFTFSCVDSTPAWLSEGLAMAAEGEPDPYHVSILEQAIEEDQLLPLDTIGGIFSGDPQLARLAYAQSLSLVEYLTQTYGQERMLSLLEAFRAGLPEDRALRTAYGFDGDGLETEWREWLGASPPEAGQSSDAGATRTPYPTYAPITGPAAAMTETPVAGGPVEGAQADAPATSQRTALVTAVLIGVIGLCGVGIVGAVGAVWLLRRGRRRG